MIGKTLAHYEITGLIGRGGMGEVYRARDTKLHRDVALKLLPTGTDLDHERRARFTREARAVAALNHPNIVTIYSVEEHEGAPFLTMELVPGTDLSKQIPENGMPISRMIALATQMAVALAAANDVGITHRDLKPANVMVTPNDQVKLLDFGLAKLGPGSDADVTAALTEALTVDGAILGTIAYMSPEQLEGRPADHRSDLFALGIILYQMATGSRPFHGPSQAAIMGSILRDFPPPARDLRAEVPAGLSGVIDACLRKQPQERYQSARELRVDLEAAAGELADHRHQSASPTTVEDRNPAIAVLPFADLSEHRDQEYFCDGMTEEIINALSGLDGVRVAARTSSFHYKGRDQDVRGIGRDLGVDLVLEGSVRTADQRLRVTAQLIKVTDGCHLWSERFSRTMDDVFAIQDEISESIASALQTTLRTSGQAGTAQRHSENIEAYHHYLRGRHCWNRRHRGVLPKGMQHFRDAIEVDPGYALAYSGLADCYNVVGYYGFERPSLAFPRSIRAAEQALELDPDQAEAHASLGYARHHFDWNLKAAEADFRRAIELKPGYAVAHQWLALVLMCSGQAGDSIAQMLKARELDPLSPVISTAVGWLCYLHGEVDRALRELGTAVELEPNFAWLSYVLGHVNLQRGQMDDSVRYFAEAVDASERASFYLAGLGFGLATAGHEPAARQIIDELMERAATEYVSREHFAAVHAGLGDREAMFSSLDEALSQRAANLIYAHVDPQFALAHGDSRFAELRRRMAKAVHT